MGMTEWHVRRVEDTHLPRYSPNARVEISHEPVLHSFVMDQAGDRTAATPKTGAVKLYAQTAL
jgi:hypothetical protein